MPRYFIELAYHGKSFAGFQKQQNANTIQAEIESALTTFFRGTFELTGSSRTDAGVHARQNFFHFDSELLGGKDLTRASYHLNAILPDAIVVKSIFPVEATSHCRFDAISRTYEYAIYNEKDPFLKDRAFFYPYKLDLSLLNLAAAEIRVQTNFEAFSKKRTQVHSFNCKIGESEWIMRDGILIYRVTANRFLRGMVRGLVGTMLQVGRNKLSIKNFQSVFTKQDNTSVDFSVPPQGLSLVAVSFK